MVVFLVEDVKDSCRPLARPKYPHTVKDDMGRKRKLETNVSEGGGTHCGASGSAGSEGFVGNRERKVRAGEIG